MIKEIVKVPYIIGTVVGFYFESLGHEKGDTLQVPFHECYISSENPEHIFWFVPDFTTIVLENCSIIYVDTKLQVAEERPGYYQDFSDNPYTYGYDDTYNEDPPF